MTKLKKAASTVPVLRLISDGEYQVMVVQQPDELVVVPDAQPGAGGPASTLSTTSMATTSVMRTVRFKSEQTAAIRDTRLYTPDDLATLVLPPRSGQSSSSGAPRSRPIIIRVTDGTTQTEARSMCHRAVASDVAEDGDGTTTSCHIAVLNFASARNPGGGFLNGAKAQEEDLCRCSGLYPCLVQCDSYYEANRQEASCLYTDHAIFSPRVPFFKTGGDGDDQLLPQPFYVSVITMPAPTVNRS
jgi:uncharacterized protein (TIGR02452 family)